MSNKDSSYRDLNLKQGATVSEIKSAFRHMAKTYHPDGAGRNQTDVEKFIKAQNAYQNLMKKAVAHNQARRAAESPATAAGENSSPPASNWRFIGQREVGLEVYFSLYILRPSSGDCRVVLPWKVQEACPRCLGQGQTLAKVGQNSIYRPAPCTKCEGRGTLARASQMEVRISADQVGQEKIRLRKAGLYSAKNARRGDLILNVTWVDELPRHN